MTKNPSGVKVVLLVVVATLLGGLLLAQDKEKESSSPSDVPVEEATADEEAPKSEPADEPASEEASEPEPPSTPTVATADAEPPPRSVTRQSVLASLTIFVLAIFVGFEVITKVPPTLHTPLMSGSNAISGITLVGAVIVAATLTGSGFVGFLAVILATINVVGGFLVTHRMLAMFNKR